MKNERGEIDRSDYRDAAIAESARLLAAAGQPAPLLAGMSLCLWADNEDEAKETLANLEMKRLSGLAAMGVLFAVGAVVFGYGIYRLVDIDHLSDVPYTTMGVLLIVGVWGVRRLARGWLKQAQERAMVDTVRDRPGGFFDYRPEQASMMIFRVADPIDADLHWPRAADLVVAYLDATNRRLVIEGLRCRYIVRGVDLLGLDPREGRNADRAIDVQYRVGEAALTLVLFHVGELDNLTAQQLHIHAEDMLDHLSYTLLGGVA
ncbi:MAG: hypothetical protein GC159_08020 [Phycisphaera sp.]|nr:hypothetical protein [Phycisphaera sp.]